MMISGQFADQKQAVNATSAAVNCAVPFVPELSRDSGAKAGIWMDWEAFNDLRRKTEVIAG